MDLLKSLQQIQEACHEIDENLRHLIASSFADSLAAHVAILDKRGMIVSVNSTWQRFAHANGAIGNYGVGTNYLDVCDEAAGACSTEAKLAADGIRRVLNGVTDFFELEYPCHSPNEERWFMVKVFPYKDDRLTGNYFIVTHENITRWVVKLNRIQAATKKIQETLRLPPSALF